MFNGNQPSVIIAGGYREDSHETIVYDCIKNIWHKLPNTINEHKYCKLWLNNGGQQLNIVGNKSSGNWEELNDSIEMYDTRSNQWNVIIDQTLIQNVFSMKDPTNTSLCNWFA